MKSQWTILIISAITDMVISAGTSIGTAMIATGSAQMPTTAVLVLSMIGGLVAAARTIQQALKVTPQTAAALRGE
jgi:hypothetical protein